MGDEYLLPSIAVVVVGGTLITGGRGHYLGMLGGVLLLTALQTLLAGTTLPYAMRAIIYGLVVLGAVLALRERRTEEARHEQSAAARRILEGLKRAAGAGTAGASGIGRAIADMLIAHGARVHVCDCRRGVLADFRAAHPERRGQAAPTSRTRPRSSGCSTTCRRALGGLDALVNNAGIAGPTGGVEEIGPADWRRCIDIDLTGQFLCARRAVPMLKAAGGGAIVNMSSAAGRLGYAFRTPYCGRQMGRHRLHPEPRQGARARTTSASTPSCRASSRARAWRA